MSNCVVWAAQDRSGEAGIPGSAVAKHGVQAGDHFAHDGEDDLGLPAATRAVS
jgi:hypothetical protein